MSATVLGLVFTADAEIIKATPQEETKEQE
jgi:hypothetical protein